LDTVPYILLVIVNMTFQFISKILKLNNVFKDDNVILKLT